jgi:hypothetical protein
VQAGAARNAGPCALLRGLADIFIEATGFVGQREALPRAPASRFIRFAAIALDPFFPETEGTPAALTSRWRRLSKAVKPTG